MSTLFGYIWSYRRGIFNLKLKLPLGDNIGLGFSNRTRRSADQSGDVTLTTGTEYDFHTVLYDMRRYDSFNLQVTGHSAFIAFGPKCWASPFRNVYVSSFETTVICRNKTPLAANFVRKEVLFLHFPVLKGYQF